MIFNRAIDLILLERERQDAKWCRGYDEAGNLIWADDETSAEKKLTILMEEVGEVARAILERDPYNLREELVQVAAVAIAWLQADFNGGTVLSLINGIQDVVSVAMELCLLSPYILLA
jgi:NTP pyrophosphatase (non-canonical NTP hydrolase)